MAQKNPVRVGILFPGDAEARRNAAPENNRFAPLFAAFAARGVAAEPVVYHDDFSDEVRRQLVKLDAVLVWINPVQGGRDRSVLDALLRDIAADCVFVSAHPDIILKLGTKEVLYRTRELGWGTDTHLYRSLDAMRRELPPRLAGGKARVLKQYRGQSGDGVWKIQAPAGSAPRPDTRVSVRHAKRGCVEEQITLGEFFERCSPYFAGDGRMIDQDWQDRLSEGMVRCYLVRDKVAGFGHQAINALHPAPAGASPQDAPPPGPRLYHPPGKPEFQALKQQLEREWVPAMQHLLGIETDALPILWDCDFLLGPKKNGADTYVLCEINASSVAPYPDSATPEIVEATISQVRGLR